MIGRHHRSTTDVDAPPAMKSDTHPSAAERAVAARNEREQLREEARYRRERLELYRARLYGGRALNESKLRELERASDGAAARLRRADAARAEAAPLPTRRPS
jgi:hypothetical protein